MVIITSCTKQHTNTQQTPVSQHQSQEPGSLPTHNRHQYHSINHRNQGVYQHTTDTSITASITGTREPTNTQQTPVSQHQSQEPGSLPTHNRHQYHSIKAYVNHRNQGVYQHTTDTSITASITGTRESTNTQQTSVSQHQSQEPGSLPTHNRHQYHSTNHRNQGVYQHITDTSITASRPMSITGTRESTNTQQTPVSQHQGLCQSQEPGSLPTHNRHQYHSIKGDSITGTRESTNTQQTSVSQHQGRLNHRNQGVYQHTTDTSITASRPMSITGTRESNNTQQTPVSQHQGRLNHRNQGAYQHTTDTSITASRATQSQEPGSLTTHNRHQYHSIKGDVNHRNQGV